MKVGRLKAIMLDDSWGGTVSSCASPLVTMDAVHCHQGITLPLRGLEEKASKDVGFGTPANRQNLYCFPQRSLDGLGHCSVGRPAMVSCH